MRSFKHVADLVKNARLNHPRRYSQNEVSSLLGYKNGQFVSNVERGLCSVPLKKLDKLAITLNIPREELKAAILRDFEATLSLYYGEIPPFKMVQKAEEVA
ncbi:MAG: helix-turn-helix domain-containing protein [Bdellovibrionales bacterium]|nr:helix-turn-helix domain-containing protein [Bdellovibrionales bacterium]